MNLSTLYYKVETIGCDYVAKDRPMSCEFYQHEGACTKGKDARNKKLCQKCGEYKTRKGFIVPPSKMKEQKNKGFVY